MLRTLERRLTSGGVDVPPSVRYLNMIVGGSEEAELDQDYLDYLHKIKAAAPWPLAGKVFFYCIFPMNEYVSQLEQKVPWAGAIVGKLKHFHIDFLQSSMRFCFMDLGGSSGEELGARFLPQERSLLREATLILLMWMLMPLALCGLPIAMLASVIISVQDLIRLGDK